MSYGLALNFGSSAHTWLNQVDTDNNHILDPFPGKVIQFNQSMAIGYIIKQGEGGKRMLDRPNNFNLLLH